VTSFSTTRLVLSCLLRTPVEVLVEAASPPRVGKKKGSLEARRQTDCRQRRDLSPFCHLRSAPLCLLLLSPLLHLSTPSRRAGAQPVDAIQAFLRTQTQLSSSQRQYCELDVHRRTHRLAHRHHCTTFCQSVCLRSRPTYHWVLTSSPYCSLGPPPVACFGRTACNVSAFGLLPGSGEWFVICRESRHKSCRFASSLLG